NCTGTRFDAPSRERARYVNCLATDMGNGFMSRSGRAPAYASHCVSVDGTATAWDGWADGREGNAANQAVSFVNAASNDYHLADADIGARCRGTVGLGTDIDGEERAGPYYDVGADQNQTAIPDADWDGLPDAWEILYFGGANAPNGGANDDADGDGMNNYAEWRAGTIPTDANSLLRVSDWLLVSGTNFVVRWSSVGGKHYAIDGSANLPAGFPVTVSSNIPATPDVNSRTVNVNRVVGQEFFRVRVQ
ncbi:MAG: hypothetical protein QME60_01775, partial [Verrucomicrobiota bacterium]|nr:hypothetical protein [Verrucomicrobiota bacterium]